MVAKDVVYVWGGYEQIPALQNIVPTLQSILGTGAASPAGQCTYVNGEASWYTFVAGGTAYGLGDNAGNQLSQDATNGVTVPVQIASNSGTPFNWAGAGGTLPLLQLEGGSQWCWGLDSAGNVFAWGHAVTGVLGNNGASTSQPIPAQVLGLGGTGTLSLKAVAGAVSGGSGHAIGLQSAGTVIGCGENDFGELGNNSLSNTNVPVQTLKGAQSGTTNLGDTTPITYISVGNKHSFALDSSGEIWGWGQNALGQCGDGTFTTPRQVPVAVDWAAAVGTATPPGTGGVTVAKISAGGGFNLVDGQTFAIDSNGVLWAWGANTYGQLGLGTNSVPNVTTVNVPNQVNIDLSGGKTIVAASSGARHGMALRSDGVLFIWGDNTSGALGVPALNAALNTGVNGAGTIGTSVPTAINTSTYQAIPTAAIVNLIWAGNATSVIDATLNLPAFGAWAR